MLVEKEHFDRGLFYLKAQVWDEAVAEFHKVLELDPVYAEAWYNIGVAYRGSERWKEAIGAFQEALKIQPRWHMVRLAIARMQYDFGNYETAALTCKEAIELGCRHPDVFQILGLAASHLGRIKEAIDAFEQLVRLRPNLADAHLNLALNYQAAHRDEDAMAEFEETVRADPDNIQAHFYLGEGYSARGWLRRAMDEYDTVLKLEPDHVRALEGIQRIEKYDRFIDAIVDEMTASTRAGTDLARCYFELGYALQHHEEMGRAIESYEAAKKIKPDWGLLRAWLGIARAVEGDVDNSIPELQAAVALDADDCSSQYALAISYYFMGRYPIAWKHARKAEQLGQAVGALIAELAVVSEEPPPEM